jgi:hypothetical protein
LTGCATNKQGYRTEGDVENQLIGMTDTEVLIDLGPPHKKAVIGKNIETWRYFAEVGGLTGGECTLALVLEENAVTQAKLSANDLSFISFPLGSCTPIIQTLR